MGIVTLLVVIIVAAGSIAYGFRLNRKYKKFNKRYRKGFVFFIPLFLATWTLTLFLKFSIQESVLWDGFLTIVNALSLTVVFVLVQEATSELYNLSEKEEQKQFQTDLFAKMDRLEKKLNQMDTQNQQKTSDIFKQLKALKKRGV